MNEPGILDDELVFLGQSFTPAYQLLDDTGAVLDLSLSTVVAVYRVLLPDGTVISRTKGVAGETSFVTDGTDGKIIFNVWTPASSSALATGDGTATLTYKSGTPATVVLLMATGRIRTALATTGVL